jgi:hypothetical protein
MAHAREIAVWLWRTYVSAIRDRGGTPIGQILGFAPAPATTLITIMLGISEGNGMVTILSVLFALALGLAVWFGQMLWILGKTGAGIRVPNPHKESLIRQETFERFTALRKLLQPLWRDIQFYEPEYDTSTDEELEAAGHDIHSDLIVRLPGLVASYAKYTEGRKALNLDDHAALATMLWGFEGCIERLLKQVRDYLKHSPEKGNPQPLDSRTYAQTVIAHRKGDAKKSLEACFHYVNDWLNDPTR